MSRRVLRVRMGARVVPAVACARSLSRQHLLCQWPSTFRRRPRSSSSCLQRPYLRQRRPGGDG